MSTGIILLAAGSGHRFRNRIPKQMIQLEGAPLFMRSLKTFLNIPSVSEVVVVGSRNILPAINRQLQIIKSRAKVRSTMGGAFRGQSVKKGLAVLSNSCDVVLIHDAARPLVDEGVIKRVEEGARQNGVALAAWPLGDTLKECGRANIVKKTVTRNSLWLAQTPQGFRRRIAEKCLTRPSPSATDDVQLAEKKGYSVKVVKGSPVNLKITYPLDLKICRALLGN